MSHKSKLLPTLEDFIFRLQDHQFSFTLSELKDFVAAQKVEAGFFEIAWSGGDPYMLAYKRAMERAKETSFAMKVDPEQKAKDHYFATLPADLQSYYHKLVNHDWHWSFSDDKGIRNRGYLTEEELRKVAVERGGQFQQLFDSVSK